MRKFTRYQMVDVYQGDQQLDADARNTPHTHRTLADRSRITSWADVVENSDDEKLWARYGCTVPDDCEVVVAAIDVQRNRLYWTITGASKDRRTWDIAWGIERARSGGDREPPPWGAGELTATITRASEWILEAAGPKFRGGVVDVGDGETVDELAKWLAKTPRFTALQGESYLPKPRPDGTLRHLTAMVAWDTKWRTGQGSYRVVTDLAQQLVVDSYKIEPGTPGAAHLPALNAGNAYLRHLTAVGWVESKAKGAQTPEKKWNRLPNAGRYDYLDCRAYGTAVALALLQSTQTPARQAGRIGRFI
jgi:phage terminase large subunit GpA-like protein